MVWGLRNPNTEDIREQCRKLKKYTNLHLEDQTVDCEKLLNIANTLANYYKKLQKEKSSGRQSPSDSNSDNNSDSDTSKCMPW